MIVLRDIRKVYPTRGGVTEVLRGVDLKVRMGEKLGILGRNGSGKSTLIRLISGAERPSSGDIDRSMTVSWPLAFAGGFQGSLTGLDNLKFICRLYGVSARDRVGFVEEFTELGKYLREPIKHYSSGMRARLAFAISMAIEFDCFLVDEVIAVGDSRFHEKCRRELFERRSDRALVLVSHDSRLIREHCSRAVVLERRLLHDFSDLEQAFQSYEADSVSTNLPQTSMGPSHNSRPMS
jgi:capsular polysaccharide transport system ATP-binding protein